MLIFFNSHNVIDKDLRPQGIKDSIDADDNYAYLHEKGIMSIISLNPRNTQGLPEPGFNEIGIPLCPYDSSLPMVYDGIIREKGRADRIKYLCPKSKRVNINGNKDTHICYIYFPCFRQFWTLICFLQSNPQN